MIDDSETGESTFNKFEMESSAEFNAIFGLDGTDELLFDFYLTFGYGFSARRPQRLEPKYYNPEFNRKAAWKVEVIPPGPAEYEFTWQEDDDTTTYDVEVRVWDWQQGATIYDNPEDFDNAPKDNIYAASDVGSVSVEIPGMSSTLPIENTAVSGIGTPDDPLVFVLSIANENLLAAGEYVGLVKVTDQRTPSSDWMQDLRDYLIDTPDGIILEEYHMPEYATYQTFNAIVLEEEIVLDPPGEIFWAKCAVGHESNIGYGITSLSDNSSVVIGHFWGSITFEPGEPNEVTFDSRGRNDIFIARYAPDGELMWVKREGGNGWDAGYSVTTLSDDSIVATGMFGWSITLGSGEPNQTLLRGGSNDSAFIARYNSDSTLEWATEVRGGTGRVYGLSVSSLPDDSTVVSGWFAGTVTFISEPGTTSGTQMTNGAGYNQLSWRDIFVAKYNPDGSLAWVKQAGGSAGLNDPNAITGLSDGTSVVTGFFTATAVFGAGEPNETTLLSGGVRDVFIARYDTDGSLLWAKKASGSAENRGNGITALSDDTTIITGYYMDSVVFGEDEPNETTLTTNDRGIFIARYDTDGSLIWAKSGNGPGSDIGYGVAVLSEDIIVVTGHLFDEITFNEGEPDEMTLYSDGDADLFIAWYYPDGSLLWAIQAASSETSNTGRGIAAFTDNSLGVTGSFTSQTIFGQRNPNETTLDHVDNNEVFIARYGY